MTRYVIAPDVALRLALDRSVIRAEHQLFAPTLLRSQVLSMLYQAVRRGEMTKKDADRGLRTYAGCACDCSATASSSRSLGRSPINSGGQTPSTPNTSR